MAINKKKQIDNPILNDMVYVTNRLDIKTLLSAYSSGIFPWPENDDLPIIWFFPNPRGILKFSNLHISKSLKKTIKKQNFTISIDNNFDIVIDKCATLKRKGQSRTWITKNTVKTYKKFHRSGHAHSVEVYNNNELVGGLYGVFVKNVFSGESMFHIQKDASKIALIALMYLLKNSGVDWVDTQMLTSVIKSMGGESISKNKYLKIIKQSKKII